MTTSQSLRQNYLLAAMPAAQCEPLVSHLQLVPMRRGARLYEPGKQLQHAYFPTTAIVSLQYVMESGAAAETAGVGREGVVGIELFMGGDSTPISAFVQLAGHAFRLDRRWILREFHRGNYMQQVLFRYTTALMNQIGLMAACNRHHSIEQRLCRSLLLMLDRVASSDLVITQAQLGDALGVRREGITEAAGNLRRSGALDYRRGHITVLDREILEAQSCECYGVLKNDFEHLLSHVRCLHEIVPEKRVWGGEEEKRAAWRGHSDNVVITSTPRSGQMIPSSAP